MYFNYTRTVRFQDTDAAGVVYFANVLAMCHEAYEESLATSGINLQSFFSDSSVAIPIVHASVDFMRPMYCGNKLRIQLTPSLINDTTFEVNYQIFHDRSEEVLAKAITKHVCIDPVIRKRKEIPEAIGQWLN